MRSVCVQVGPNDEVTGVTTFFGITFKCRACVLTTGTFMNGTIWVGRKSMSAGRWDRKCGREGRSLTSAGGLGGSGWAAFFPLPVLAPLAPGLSLFLDDACARAHPCFSRSRPGRASQPPLGSPRRCKQRALRPAA